MNPRRRDVSAPKPVESSAERTPVAATRKARSSAPSKELPNAPEHVETRRQTEISDPEQAYRERLQSLISERDQVRTQGNLARGRAIAFSGLAGASALIALVLQSWILVAVSLVFAGAAV